MHRWLDKRQYSFYTEKGKRANEQPLLPQSHFSAVDCFYRVFFAEPLKVQAALGFVSQSANDLIILTARKRISLSADSDQMALPSVDFLKPFTLLSFVLTFLLGDKIAIRKIRQPILSAASNKYRYINKLQYPAVSGYGNTSERYSCRLCSLFRRKLDTSAAGDFHSYHSNV